VACQHLIQRVANQQHVHPGLLEEPRERGVVAGQHDDPAARRFHRRQVED
jgi:hypothetical protein